MDRPVGMWTDIQMDRRAGLSTETHVDRCIFGQKSQQRQQQTLRVKLISLCNLAILSTLLLAEGQAATTGCCAVLVSCVKNFQSQRVTQMSASTSNERVNEYMTAQMRQSSLHQSGQDSKLVMQRFRQCFSQDLVGQGLINSQVRGDS